MSKLTHLNRELKAGDMVCIFKPSQLIMLLTEQNARNFNEMINNASNIGININSFSNSQDLWLIEPILPNIQAGQSYRIAPVMNGLKIGDAIYNNQTGEFIIINESNIAEMTSKQTEDYNNKKATFAVLPYKTIEDYALEFNEQMTQKQQYYNNQFNPFGNKY